LRPLLALFFSFRIPRPPSSTLFPYTTLFRSDLADPESTRPEVGEREVALRVGRGPRLISVRLAVVVQVAVDDPAGDARPPVAVAQLVVEHPAADRDELEHAEVAARAGLAAGERHVHRARVRLQEAARHHLPHPPLAP